MSKRANQRQRGWIEFKGLQHAAPFMTRKELVETIHLFFKERGLNLNTRTTPLVIVFSCERNPRGIIDGAKKSIAGVHNLQEGMFPLTTENIVVYVRRHASRFEFVDTLFHELDHCAWVLQGRTLDHRLRYMIRPHEVRARQAGRKWSRRLSR